MFQNLLLFQEFREHNFRSTGRFLHRVPSPTFDVDAAIRGQRRFQRDAEAAATLSYTLRPECCASFLKANPDLPATERDYYLTKIFEALFAATNRGAKEEDAVEHFDRECERLETALDAALPEGSPFLSRLWLIDWKRLFEDSETQGVVASVRRITSYLPPTVAVPAAGSVATRETPAQLIDRLRVAGGFKNIEELARKAGLNPKQIYTLKKGGNVTMETIKTLAATLGCSPRDLL
jgi:DNA-binding phage protein